jgi:hypothetical protein
MHKQALAFLIIALALLINGCKEEPTAVANVEAKVEAATVTLDVYKSPTCGCCGEWVSHIELNGFSTRTHHPTDLNALKQQQGIANQYQSCHTAVSEQGYIFEGHVPAKFVKQFLAEKPSDAIGLAVPAMPLGSPGMEVADRFTSYQVLLLKKDGSSEVYADIQSYQQQF